MKRSKHGTDPRTFPPAVKRRALQLYGDGHPATSVAAQLNISADTVRRWAKENCVKRGKLINAKLERAMQEEKADESLVAGKLLADFERKGELHTQIAATSSPAEQYRALVVANGVKMLDAAFKAPPIVKNMRDLKTLTEIVNDALGVTGKKGGGKLSIDLNILTAKRTTETIEAEIIPETS